MLKKGCHLPGPYGEVLDTKTIDLLQVTICRLVNNLLINSRNLNQNQNKRKLKSALNNEHFNALHVCM